MPLYVLFFFFFFCPVPHIQIVIWLIVVCHKKPYTEYKLSWDYGVLANSEIETTVTERCLTHPT